jgi:nucleosome binding factor SPN SPT16 subunit
MLVSKENKKKINLNYIYSLDKRYETVILPINGIPTPFHISTIKVYEKYFF